MMCFLIIIRNKDFGVLIGKCDTITENTINLQQRLEKADTDNLCN